MERLHRTDVNAIASHEVSTTLESLGYYVSKPPESERQPAQRLHFVKIEGNIEYHWVFLWVGARLRPNNFYVSAGKLPHSNLMEIKESEINRLQEKLVELSTTAKTRPLLRHLKGTLFLSKYPSREQTSQQGKKKNKREKYAGRNLRPGKLMAKQARERRDPRTAANSGEFLDD